MRKLVFFSIAALMMAPAANAQSGFIDTPYIDYPGINAGLPEKPYIGREGKLKWVANWVNTTCASKKWGAKKKCAWAWAEINKGLAEKRAAEALRKID
jgi:hypothetical protein